MSDVDNLKQELVDAMKATIDAERRFTSCGQAADDAFKASDLARDTFKAARDQEASARGKLAVALGFATPEEVAIAPEQS